MPSKKGPASMAILVDQQTKKDRVVYLAHDSIRHFSTPSSSFLGAIESSSAISKERYGVQLSKSAEKGTVLVMESANRGIGQ